MSKYDIPGVRIGDAAVLRVDQGEGEASTLEQCKAAVTHPTTGAKREDLVEAIAYLAAQVIGYRNSTQRDALLAINAIGREIDEYRRRNP